MFSYGYLFTKDFFSLDEFEWSGCGPSVESIVMLRALDSDHCVWRERKGDRRSPSLPSRPLSLTFPPSFE